MAATTPPDNDLLRAVRDGDRNAFTELYLRHRPAALRLARSYRVAGDPEDLVSDAFARVLGAIRRGGGPEDSFRPYLYVTLRRLAVERCLRARREDLVPVPETVIDVTDGPGADDADRELIAAAFADLPDRWQTVLWQTAVEGRAPRDVARDTGMEPNTVSVLAHRARERLREAYLQAHVGPACDARCRPHRGRLGAYVRGGLSRRQQAAAEEHVGSCDDCRRLVIELDDVNRMLARAVAPVFALAARDGVLGPEAVAALGAAGGSATSAASVTGNTAVGAAGGAAAVATGAGAGLGVVAKVGAVLTAVAVVGAAAVAPVLDGGRDSPDTVRIAAPSAAGDAGQGTSSDDGDTAPPETTGTRAPSAADATSPSSDVPDGTVGVDAGLDADLGGLGVDAGADVSARVGQEGLDVGADVDVDLGPHDVDVDATVRAGPRDGVALDATWTVASAGRGTLDLEVVNPTTETLAAVDARVDLSPRARATSLLGACEPADPSLLGAVLALVGALTCGLGEIGALDDATASLALAVGGPHETATVSIVTGGRVVARTEVPLAP